MTLVSRRDFVAGSAAGAALAGAAAAAIPSKGAAAELKSLTTTAQPISAAEHNARLEKLQSLMQNEENEGGIVLVAKRGILSSICQQG